MATLFLYLGITIIGYFLGAGARKHAGGFAMSFYPWIGRLEMISVAVLVFIIGGRIGASEEIIRSLGTIGLKAFAYTLIIMAAAVGAFAVVRRLLGFDRYGRRGTQEAGQEKADEEASSPRINKFMVLIVAFVSIGILSVYLFLPDALLAVQHVLTGF